MDSLGNRGFQVVYCCFFVSFFHRYPFVQESFCMFLFGLLLFTEGFQTFAEFILRGRLICVPLRPK